MFSLIELCWANGYGGLLWKGMLIALMRKLVDIKYDGMRCSWCSKEVGDHMKWVCGNISGREALVSRIMCVMK
jgi:hypothetical protein